MQTLSAQASLLQQSRIKPLELVFWLLAFAAPVLTPSHALIINEIAIVALFAISLDIILGYTGIVSLGHAAFFGLGGYAAALFAAFCGAYGTVFAARHLKTRPALELATVQSLFAGLMAMPMGVPVLAHAWPLSTQVILALIALSVLCTTVANLLYYRLMKRTGPAVSMTVTYLIPCFSLLWGWLFLDETITLLQLGGFAVVLAAVALVAGRGR
jgi:drug/metabolite transporter (DMT)-like permease